MKEKRMAAPSCQGEGQAHNSNSKIISFDDKLQPLSVVDEKALFLLRRHAPTTSGGFYSLPEVRRVWSWLLHLSRGEVFRYLKELEGRGLLVQVPGHGVRLVKNQEVGR